MFIYILSFFLKKQPSNIFQQVVKIAVCLPAILWFSVSLSGCGGGDEPAPPNKPPSNKLPSSTKTAKPTFSAAGGSFQEDITIALASTTANASIYFSLDGSVPTIDASNRYESPIAIQGDGTQLTLTAIATAPDASNSEVVQHTYTIDYPILTAPQFNIDSGRYLSPQTVELSHPNSDVVIWYTIDGSEPIVGESQRYDSGFIAGSVEATVITAIAEAPGFKPSAVSRIEFDLSPIGVTETDFQLTLSQQASDSSAQVEIFNNTDESLPVRVGSVKLVSFDSAAKGDLLLSGAARSYRTPTGQASTPASSIVPEISASKNGDDAAFSERGLLSDDVFNRSLFGNSLFGKSLFGYNENEQKSAKSIPSPLRQRRWRQEDTLADGEITRRNNDKTSGQLLAKLSVSRVLGDHLRVGQTVSSDEFSEKLGVSFAPVPVTQLTVLSTLLSQKTGSEKHVLVLLQLSDSDQPSTTIPQLEALDYIAYAEPNYAMTADQAFSDSLPPESTIYQPNDPGFEYQYALHNTGQEGGKPDADIDAPEAWQLALQAGYLERVKIAVIDTGVAYHHPDLSPNIWTNPLEIPDNQIDDDNNGYVDDVYGYDFQGHDGDPWPDFFDVDIGFYHHGTHVMGIIGSAHNDSHGVTGVMPVANFISIRRGFDRHDQQATIAAAITAFDYAQQNRARVINASWGVNGFSQALKDAIENFDGLVVFAPDNNSVNIDAPDAQKTVAGYDSENILSVASLTRHDTLSSFSNYGAVSIDLGAFGSEIISPIAIDEDYSYANGTSMAAPLVTGIAGLALSYDPSLTTAELKALIMETVEPLPSLTDKTVTGGRANAYNVMEKLVTRWLTTELAAAELMAGESTHVSLSLEADGVESGRYQFEVPLIVGEADTNTDSQNTDNNARSNYTLNIAVEVSACRELSLADGDELDLGIVQPGKPLPFAITFRNTCNTPVVIWNVDIPETMGSIRMVGDKAVKENSTTTLRFEYHPAKALAEGAEDLTLTINTSADNNPSLAYRLRMEVDPGARLNLEATSVEFQSVNNNAINTEGFNQTASVVIRNTGNQVLTATIDEALENYQLITTETKPSLASQWVDIEAPENLYNPNCRSDGCTVFDYPWTFADEPYQSLYMSGYGVIAFDHDGESGGGNDGESISELLDLAFPNTELPSLEIPPNSLAFFWADLEPDFQKVAYGDIYVAEHDESFIVSYVGVPIFNQKNFSTHKKVTVQLQLHPDGQFDIIYAAGGEYLSKGTVGYQLANGAFHQLVYNQSHLKNGFKARYTPTSQAWLKPIDETFSLAPGEEKAIQLRASTADLASGVYEHELSIKSNSTVQPVTPVLLKLVVP